MFNKLFAAAIASLFIAGALQAAPEHIPTEKAFQDQNGNRFHNELRRECETKGVPKAWPHPGARGNRYHLKGGE